MLLYAQFPVHDESREPVHQRRPGDGDGHVQRHHAAVHHTFGHNQILYVWMFEFASLLILFFTKPSINIFRSITAGVGALAGNATNMFSDILSYIRLWAVGLAGGKVAGAFNDIGSMASAIPYVGVIIQILIFVFGHILNIILSCISILAHAVRLNLLEFSNHVGLEWAGREYEPFKENKGNLEKVD